MYPPHCLSSLSKCTFVTLSRAVKPEPHGARPRKVGQERNETETWGCAAAWCGVRHWPASGGCCHRTVLQAQWDTEQAYAISTGQRSPPLVQQALPLLLQNKVTEGLSLQSLSFSSSSLNPAFLSSIASGRWCPLPCSFASSVCVQGATGVGDGQSTIQDVGASLALPLISLAVSWHYRLVIATT